ncbi:hypothetical protein ES708_07283 [subsurface metagenome]
METSVVILYRLVSYNSIVRISVSLLPSGVGSPRFPIKSCPNTRHSESPVFVPADAAQLVLPIKTPDFLNKVKSLVASGTPATSHPVSGSSPSVPIRSISIHSSSTFFARPMASLPLKLTAWLPTESATDNISLPAFELQITKTSPCSRLPSRITALLSPSDQSPPL